jgi:beta-N-acetylhexosaminidase
MYMKSKSKRLHLLLVILLPAVIISVSFNPVVPVWEKQTPIDPPFLDSASQWVDSVFNSLSLDEQIAQMVMIAAYSNRGPEHMEEITDIIKRYKVGGIIFFQGGPVRQAAMTNHFQSVSQTPLLIAMDAEWGLGMRLDSTLSYPRQMMLGAIQDNSLIYEMGRDIALQLKRIGVHVNFAPVVDVNNNPANPVINSRSFGEQTENVIQKGIAYMNGMQDKQLLCTAKHFPGHGDTDTDSHYALPVILHERDRLENVELAPFRACIRNGITGIMIAHLNVPALDSTPGRASSFSGKIINGLLREDLGFKGLVFTDALNMRAVSDQYEPDEMAVQAVLAGNDILVMPPDIRTAIRAIRREVRRGDISRDIIEQRCKRILLSKKWVGLDHYQPVNMEGIIDDLNDNRFKLLQTKLVESALTLLTNEQILIPLNCLDTLEIASLAFGEDTINDFQQYLGLYADVRHFQIPDSMTDDVRTDSLLKLLEPYNLVIAGIHHTDMRVSRGYGITDEAIQLIEEIASEKKLILNVFANPYCLRRFRNIERFDGLIVGYEDNDLAQRFAAQMIFGGISSSGLLPVSTGGTFNAGYGISTGYPIRLKYSLPEAAGIDSKLLYKIDTIALDAIKVKAIPGCQILAARHGTVFYHRSFGYHTYAKKRPVQLTDMYDVASVTKITGTLPSIIRLVDRGLIDVNGKLGDYLPWLDTCDKGELILKDILTHCSGLVAWIPFYYRTLEPMDPDDSLISNKLTPRYPFRLSEDTYLNKNLQYVENVYSKKFSEDFPYQVAEDMYMNRTYRDSINYWIYNSKLSGEKKYVYSDLGLILCQQVIEEITDTCLYSYVNNNFYKKLGTNLTGYLPLQRFPKDRIAPTENDIYFRRQLLQGYVHDPGSAMLGGIAGHAGVFSNANDLAKIMQMYLQKGNYGGIRFFADTTFDMFNSCPYCDEGNRRGLGFDKPELDPEKEGPGCDSISPSSFGHSGFTGTFVWADPESGIVYVFLSNRVHPDQDNEKLYDMNIRPAIQQVIYDARMEDRRIVNR